MTNSAFMPVPVALEYGHRNHPNVGKPGHYLDWNPSPPVFENLFKRTLKQGLGMSLDE